MITTSAINFADPSDHFPFAPVSSIGWLEAITFSPAESWIAPRWGHQRKNFSGYMETSDETSGSTSSGGAPSLMELLEQYESQLVAYAYRLSGSVEEAQDAVQETFLRYHEKLTGPDGFTGNARAWLYRVAHNLAMDTHRKGKRATEYADREKREAKGHTHENPPDYARQEAALLAREKLRELDDRERQIVMLRIDEDMSYKEIAEIMDLTDSNVGYILHHALKKLATKLEEAGAV